MRGFTQLRHQDLVARLARECEQSTQKAVAAKLGISRQHLSKILNGHHLISADVAAKMGFARVLTFVKWTGDDNP